MFFSLILLFSLFIIVLGLVNITKVHLLNNHGTYWIIISGVLLIGVLGVHFWIFAKLGLLDVFFYILFYNIFVIFNFRFLKLMFIFNYCCLMLLFFILLGLDFYLFFTKIVNLSVLFYFLICICYFINCYQTFKLSVKCFMSSILLSLLLNIFLLFFTKMFLKNLSFTQSFILSNILLVIFILLLILLFKVFLRGQLFFLYLFILNVLKFTITIYFMSLFYLYIGDLLNILLKVLSLDFFLKVIIILSSTHALGSFMFFIVYLDLLISDESFCFILFLFLDFIIIFIFLLVCYHFYFVYLFNLFFFSGQKSFYKPSSRVSSFGRSCFSQSSFRSVHTEYPCNITCNVSYPNISKEFLDNSLVFKKGNIVNAYCTLKEYNSIVYVLDIVEIHNSKVGNKISRVNFRVGSVVYVGICEKMGYDFLDRYYFLTYFTKSVHQSFYSNSILGNTFYKGVLMDVDPELWISRLDSNGIFKDSFLQTLINSDDYYSTLIYDVSVLKFQASDQFFHKFPLVRGSYLVKDMFTLRTLSYRDQAFLSSYVRKNNDLVKGWCEGYNSEALKMVLCSSKDYEFYLNNCKGRIGS